MFIHALFAYTGVIALITAALAFSWWRRSIIVAVVACIVILLAGGWFEPWLAFMPAAGDDPLYFQALRFRQILAIAWLVLGLAGLTTLVALIQLRRL